MKNLVCEIFSNIKRSKNIVIISLVVFLVGFLLGLIITVNDEIFVIHKSHLFLYYEKIFSNEKLGLSLLISRIINSLFILVFVGVFSLNKYTFYLNFLVLFYRAFILAIIGKIFILELLVLGAILYVFLILVQAIFISIAIIVFMAIIYNKNGIINNCFFSLIIKAYLISAVIAIIGSIIEFLLIIMLFRPLNLYF